VKKMVAMALGQTGSTVLPTRTSTWKRSRRTWSAAISDTTTNEMRVAGFIGASDVLSGRSQPNVSDVVIGQLPARTAAAFARRTIGLIRARRRPVRTITADNGTELTGSRLIERRTPEHGAAHPTGLHPHRPPAQPPAPQTPRLSHPGGVLSLLGSVALQS